jgi:hypothetical protein
MVRFFTIESVLTVARREVSSACARCGARLYGPRREVLPRRL